MLTSLIIGLPLAATAGPVAERAAEFEAGIETKGADDLGASFDALVGAAWKAIPFSIRLATLVDGIPTGFRQYKVAEANSFKSGDTLTIYAEPIGYSFKTVGEHSRLSVSAGYALYSAVAEEKRPLVEAEDAFQFTRSGLGPTREFFTVTQLKFSSIRPGDYILELRFADNIGDETATVEIPFVITGDAADGESSDSASPQ